MVTVAEGGYPKERTDAAGRVRIPRMVLVRTGQPLVQTSF
jgi:hypothetical protein